MPTLYLKDLRIEYVVSSALEQLAYTVSDINSRVLDLVTGLLYGDPLPAPLRAKTSDDYDAWLLEMNEQEDRVVANGKVFPVVAHLEPPAVPLSEYRYWRISGYPVSAVEEALRQPCRVDALIHLGNGQVLRVQTNVLRPTDSNIIQSVLAGAQAKLAEEIDALAKQQSELQAAARLNQVFTDRYVPDTTPSSVESIPS